MLAAVFTNAERQNDDAQPAGSSAALMPTAANAADDAAVSAVRASVTTATA
jgi:hypothetical protein